MDKDLLRILIVNADGANDELITRNLFSEIEIWACKPEYITAYNQALATMLDNQHDVYLVDHRLNERNGLELLREATEQGCQAPLILLVEAKDHQTGSAALKIGAADYLFRDQLSVAILEHAIRQALHHAKTLRALLQSEARLRQLIVTKRKQCNLADALQNVAIVLNSTLNLDKLLERILSNVQQVVPHDNADIVLLESGFIRVVGEHGYTQDEETPIVGLRFELANLPAFQQMLKTKQPLVIPHTEKDSRWVDFPHTRQIRSYVGAPIDFQEETVGFINLSSATPDFYNWEHATDLQAFANQAGVAIRNAQLLVAEREQRLLAETLSRVGLALNSTLDLPELLNLICQEALALFKVGATFLWLVQGDELVGYAGYGLGKDKFIGIRHPLSDPLSLGVRVIREKRAIWVNDALNSNHANPELVRRFNVKAILGVPLINEDEAIGALMILDTQQAQRFNHNDTNTSMVLGNYAAIAIQNVKLLQAAQEARQLSDSLREIGATLVETLNLEEVLNRILDGLGKVVPYDSASVMLIDGGVLRIKAGRGFPDDIPAWSHPFVIEKGEITYEICQTKKSYIIPDVHQDSRFILLEGTEYIRGWLGAPLVTRDEVIGLLNLDKKQPNFYTKEHATIATAFAHQAAIAIENARLFTETRRRAEQLEALRQVTQDITILRNPNTLLRQIGEQALRLLGGDGGGIHLYRPETQTLEGVVALGKDLTPTGTTITPQQGLIGQVWITGQPLIINDYVNWPQRLTNWPGKIPQAAIGVPIQWGDEFLGVLSVNVNNPYRHFTPEDARLLSQFAAQAAITIENTRLFDASNQRVAELEAVRQATLSLTSSLEFQDVLEAILKSTLTLLNGAKNAHIFLYQANRLTFGAAMGHDGPKDQPVADPRPHGLTYTVAQQGQPIIVPDMRTHPLFNNAPSDWEGTIIGLPLKIGQHVVGVMTIAGQQSNTWSKAELRVLSLLADQAAIAIENARLYKKEQKHAAELEARVAERTFKLQTLYDLAHTLGHATQPGDVIRLTLLHLYQTVPHDVAACLLVTETTNTLVIQSQHALSETVEAQIQKKLLNTMSHKKGQTTDEKILEVHRIQPKDEIELLSPLNRLGSVVTVPILVNKNVVGLFLVATEEESQFDDDQIRLLYIVANQVADTLGRLQSLLAAEHQRLENLVAYLPSGIIMLDAERRMVLANPIAKDLIAILTEAQLGEKLTWLGQYPIETILESAPTEAPFTVETKAPAKQVFEIIVKPITAGPETGGWTLVIRDITEQRIIQKQIQQQERMAAVGQLAAGIAHDFNNILTSIIGFAELLLLEPTLSSSIKNDVERITKQGHRAAHLVRQILDFSRQTISAKQPLDLVPFLKETVKLLERTIPENIHISLNIEPGEYKIAANLTQMQQALTNLAINARDAMPTGGYLYLHLSRLVVPANEEPPCPDMPPGEWVTLTISDTGSGIVPEYQGQIFEPFFTTKKVGEGTGLGLAQVYGIVKQHDGFIEVNSKVGLGTHFTLYLPAQPVLQQTSPSGTNAEIPRGNNEIILLVEDDSSVRTITTNMLKHLGYRVLAATNGYEALEVYNQHQNDIALVLTDLTMPKMGGIELTRALRKQNPAVKVVALTGYPLDMHAKKALTHRMVDWLQKPLTIKQLAQTVNRTLNLEKKE